MDAKIIIIIMFVGMVFVLFQGLYHMLKASHDTPENRGKLVKSLTWRIGIWVVLLAFIVLAKEVGWLNPSESMNPKKLHQEMQERDVKN